MKNKYIYLAVAIAITYSIHAQNYFLTQRGNNQRTGSYLNENILTTTNVTVDGFGKLYSYPVDGQVYAQPLYVPGLDIPGKGRRNVLFIATEHNSVYAYDADSLTTPLWKASLGPSCSLPDDNFNAYGPYHDFKVEIGITSTPVIDTTSNTLFAVAFSKENGVFYHKLYAIDITTGGFKMNSPVTISATVAGNGAASKNGYITFESKRQLQRPALILSNGVIYIMFASYADIDPYHGWILGYNSNDLVQKYIFNTTPNGAEGGIWMSGQGASVDNNGDIYLTTANGDFNANTGGTEYGNSFIKLHPTKDSLAVTDYFTPYNQAFLNSVDGDLGVDAPILIPNSNMIIGGSKQGVLYVVDRTNMGKYNTSSCNCDNQILQSMNVFNGQLQASPAYWQSNSGEYLYAWSANDHLKAFKRNGNTFDTTPSSQSTNLSPGGYEIPGGILSITSNGTKPGTGIVWGNVPLTADSDLVTVQGVLRAFDATDLSKEIWNSNQNSFRDASGNFAKFNAPIIINGKVYQPSFSGQVSVYGLNPAVIFREPDNPGKVVNGLIYNYYESSFSNLTNINSITPLKTDSIPDFSLSSAGTSANYALSFHGYINIDKDGLYDFYLNSDDGSNLLIGNSVIVNNDGLHLTKEVHGSIALKAGKHAITVNYFQQSGEANLDVSYSAAGIPKGIIPASILYRDSIFNTSVIPINQNYSVTFLKQNYPNPASQFTKIEFGVNKPEKVVITLFNIDGTIIRTLFQGNVNETTALDLDTSNLPNGVYFYKMVAGNNILTKPLFVLN